MKLAVVNYTGNRANWGCQATSLELIEELRAALPAEEIEFMLVPLLPKTKADRFVDRYFGGFLKKSLSLNRCGPLRRTLLWLLTFLIYRGHLLAVGSCDVVCFQAEGTMAGTDFFKGVRLLLLPFVAKTVLGKPVLSLNQTIFCADRAFAPIITNCYNIFDLVAVREPASMQYAAAAGIEHPVLIPDSAFLTQPVDEPVEELLKIPLERDYFCLSGSAILRFVGAEEYLDAAIAAGSEFGLEAVLLFSAADDLQFLKALKKRRKDARFAMVPGELKYRQVSRVISGAKFLVGGRYHMAILAAAVRVPFILLPSNTFKNEGLIELLRYPLKLRQFGDLAGLADDIRQVMRQREEIVAHLDAQMREILALKAQGRSLIAACVAEVQAAPQPISRDVFFGRHPEFAPLGQTAQAAISAERVTEYQEFQLMMDRQRGLIK